MKYIKHTLASFALIIKSAFNFTIYEPKLEFEQSLLHGFIASQLQKNNENSYYFDRFFFSLQHNKLVFINGN
jgi:hypothetical protein